LSLTDLSWDRTGRAEINDAIAESIKLTRVDLIGQLRQGFEADMML